MVQAQGPVEHEQRGGDRQPHAERGAQERVVDPGSILVGQPAPAPGPAPEQRHAGAGQQHDPQRGRLAERESGRVRAEHDGESEHAGARRALPVHRRRGLRRRAQRLGERRGGVERDADSVQWRGEDDERA